MFHPIRRYLATMPPLSRLDKWMLGFASLVFAMGACLLLLYLAPFIVGLIAHIFKVRIDV